MTDPIKLDLKGCIKNKGIVCIPIPELVKLFERFPYHNGKDFQVIFNQANASNNIPEIDKETK